MVTLEPSSTEKEAFSINGLVRAYSKETSLKERIEPNRFWERDEEAVRIEEVEEQGMSLRARREAIVPLNKLIGRSFLRQQKPGRPPDMLCFEFSVFGRLKIFGREFLKSGMVIAQNTSDVNQTFPISLLSPLPSLVRS
jgi:hypothetical protein